MFRYCNLQCEHITFDTIAFKIVNLTTLFLVILAATGYIVSLHAAFWGYSSMLCSCLFSITAELCFNPELKHWSVVLQQLIGTGGTTV